LLKNQPDDIQPAYDEVDVAYHSLLKLIWNFLIDIRQCDFKGTKFREKPIFFNNP
jgi:hypothetical protein